MIERTQDYRRIKRFPEWPLVVDSEIFYLMETKDGKDMGVWAFHQWWDGLLIHASLGPECRGRDAVNSAKEAFRWIFENTGYKKIYAEISNEKRPAQFVASWAGMDYIYSNQNKRYYLTESDVRAVA